MNKKHLKPKAIEIYRECRAIGLTCEKLGISYNTFRNWIREDEEFASAIQLVEEVRIDFVESKLMEQIKNGDTTAIIFFMKTKGKKRGYSEKPPKENVADIEEKKIQNEKLQAENKKAIKAKADYIRRVLKENGRYSEEMTFQVQLAAKLVVRTDMLAKEIFDGDHSATYTELSREGDARIITDPREKLFLEYANLSQKALKALGAVAGDKAASDDGSANLAKLFDALRDD